MKREKTTKTDAELNIPVHPVLQLMIERWWTMGWAEFMGRSPTEADLIFPRQDGAHRLVSGTYKTFQADCLALGIPPQRQYETRATFRNLAGSFDKEALDMITHPKPVTGPDFYRRLEAMWSRMCDVVLAVPVSAWDGGPDHGSGDGGGGGGGEVTPEVTFRVTAGEAANEKPPVPKEETGGKMEREKGFEPAEVAHANGATGHANPHDCPDPQRFPASFFLRTCPQPSAPVARFRGGRVEAPPAL